MRARWLRVPCELTGKGTPASRFFLSPQSTQTAWKQRCRWSWAHTLFPAEPGSPFPLLRDPSAPPSPSFAPCPAPPFSPSVCRPSAATPSPCRALPSLCPSLLLFLLPAPPGRRGRGRGSRGEVAMDLRGAGPGWGRCPGRVRQQEGAPRACWEM